jgi:hypothetical protein
MAADSTERRRMGAMERHIQTGLAGLCSLGIVAVVGLTWDMSRSVERQATQIEGVVTTIGELKSEMASINERFRLYMPREEADAKLQSLRERDVDHARRIERLEHREGL